MKVEIEKGVGKGRENQPPIFHLIHKPTFKNLRNWGMREMIEETQKNLLHQKII